MSEQRWRIHAREFVLPKEGADADECEDAVGVNSELRRYALADGATEAFDSKSWAKRLAEGWVAAETAATTAESFGAWVAEQGRALQESWDGRTLPWYAEEKARAGSFAAFVGLRFLEDGRHLRAEVIALGDACMIHLRGGALHCAMPLSDAREFNSTPPLVPSQEALQEAALAKVVTDAGPAEHGDIFLLLSDAAAAWFLSLGEEDAPLRARFDALLTSSDAEPLAELFRDERRAGRIKDDDVAVVRVFVERV
ncbi:MAG TPA: hypothetical protein VEQ42_05800 [Pyrinomonadaceae bacterium]|nr:hypothetical protein [Pyrinomonadaceae bacterium]